MLKPNMRLKNPSKKEKDEFFQYNRTFEMFLPLENKTGSTSKVNLIEIMTLTNEFSPEELEGAYIQSSYRTGGPWKLVLMQSRTDEELNDMYATHLESYKKEMKAFKKELKKHEIDIEAWRARELTALEKQHERELARINEEI